MKVVVLVMSDARCGAVLPVLDAIMMYRAVLVLL
jgi:hypothetical protein